MVGREIDVKNNALKINPSDNVVIALENLRKGDMIILGDKRIFSVAEDIQAGHKIALVHINKGEKIYRYGEPILKATREINPGGWVHVHNTQPIPGDMTA